MFWRIIGWGHENKCPLQEFIILLKQPNIKSLDVDMKIVSMLNFLLIHVKGYILLLHDVNTINMHIQTICCTFTGCSPAAKARQCCEFVKRLSFNSWCSSCYDTNINRLWWLSRYRYCAGNVSCCIYKQLW